MAQTRTVLDIHLEYVDRSRLRIPRSSPVARPALIAGADRGVRDGLVLVSAPAGWGKTSLLTAWARATAMPVAWLTLTPEENDPVPLFRSLSAAMELAVPGWATDVPAMIRLADPASVADIMTVLLASLDELACDIALVLDDFHHIDRPDLLAAMERLVLTAPPKLHPLIATRVDPPWPLARPRASGALTEFRAVDLRLSATEAQAMIGIATLSDPAMATLIERTEGWAAGVRLASFAAGRQTNPDLVIGNLRGTQRDIADYLVEQVIARQPPEIREFLSATSILDRLSGPLCDALLDRADSQTTLEHLEASNLFLLPLDDERRWYRYHTLFADLLRTRLERQESCRVAALHGRAAAWFTRESMVSDAVPHLLRARAWRDAAALIDQAGETFLFANGLAATLVRWIETLPGEILPDYPRLLRYFAWGLTLTGRLDDAGALLATVIRDFLDPDDPDEPRQRRLRAEVAAIRSRLAAYQSAHEVTIAAGNEALALLGDTRDRIAGDVSVSLGFAYRALGRTEEAATAFARGSAIGWNTGNMQAALWGARYHALIRVTQGRLNDADAILDDEFTRLAEADITPGPAEAALLVGRAELQYERNDLSGALASVADALSLTAAAGDAKILMTIYVVQARVQQALGHSAEATAAARHAQQIFGEHVPLAIPAQIALLQGDIAAAIRWAEALGFRPGDEPGPTMGENERITFGRVLLAQGQTAAGRAWLQQLLDTAEAGGRWGNAIELLVTLAISHEQSGERDEAVRLLARATRMAAPEHYVRTFADEGPNLIPVFRALLRDPRFDDAPRDYVNLLCEAIGGVPADDPTRPPELAERLTDRELDVLRLVAEGLPNRSIAARLFLAEGTVKAHVNHINGKLLARNRTEAVAQARRLGLI